MFTRSNLFFVFFSSFWTKNYFSVECWQFNAILNSVHYGWDKVINDFSVQLKVFSSRYVLDFFDRRSIHLDDLNRFINRKNCGFSRQKNLLLILLFIVLKAIISIDLCCDHWSYLFMLFIFSQKKDPFSSSLFPRIKINVVTIRNNAKIEKKKWNNIIFSSRPRAQSQARARRQNWKIVKSKICKEIFDFYRKNWISNFSAIDAISIHFTFQRFGLIVI